MSKIGFHYSGLRLRLILIVLLSVVPASGLLLLTAADERRIASEEIQKSVFRLANFVAREENRLLDSTKHLLISLGEFVHFTDADPTKCSLYFKTLIDSYERYINIGVVGENGVVASCAVPETQWENVSSEDWFKGALESDELSIGHYEWEDDAEKPVIYFALATPRDDAGRKVVVFASMNLFWLNRFEFEVEKHLPHDSTLTKIDKKGRILASQPDNGKRIGHKITSEVLLRTFYEKKKGLTLHTDDSGKAWYYAFMPVDSDFDTDVRLILKIPRNGLYASTNRILKRNIIILGLVSIIVLLAAWGGAELFVMRRVETLRAAARKIADGDYSARTGLRASRDGISELAGAFDEMAAALEQRDAERREAEAQLKRSQERLSDLAAYIEVAREDERKRFAHEIHDELGQSLTVLNLDVAWLRENLEDAKPVLLEKTESMRRLIMGTSQAVQRIATELRPSVLDDLGLFAALEWLVEEFDKRSELQCTIEIDCNGFEIDTDVSVAVFRIVQEGLTNVVKHAAAEHVWVNVKCEDGVIKVDIKDDGRGIQPEEIDDVRSFGIAGMQERVRRLGGEFTIEGKFGEGTALSVLVPSFTKRVKE